MLRYVAATANRLPAAVPPIILPIYPYDVIFDGTGVPDPKTVQVVARMLYPHLR